MHRQLVRGGVCWQFGEPLQKRGRSARHFAAAVACESAAPQIDAVGIAVLWQAVHRQGLAERHSYECQAVRLPELLKSRRARRVRRVSLCLVSPKFQAEGAKGALGGDQHIWRKLWWNDDRHIVEVSQNADAVRVHAAFAGKLAQVVFEFGHPGRQAASEEQGSERVSLVHAAGGSEFVAASASVPEEVPGPPPGEEACARLQFGGKFGEPLQASFPVS